MNQEELKKARQEIRFTKRPHKDKYQVRFWSTPQQHSRFMAACEKEGIIAQDALNDFLDYFCEQSAQGTIEIIQPFGYEDGPCLANVLKTIKNP